MINNTLLNYKNLYDSFSNFCNHQEEKVNLYGLSLGGILALDFENIGCSKKEFITLVNSMCNLNIATNLSKIKCKCFILCGAKDSTNMKSAKLLNDSIKNSKIKIISNSSHEVNIDNPEELSIIIYNFWKDIQ